MNSQRVDSGIPVLTEIIANTPGSVEAIVESSEMSSILDTVPFAATAGSANAQPELQRAIATQIMQQFSSQLDTLIDQHLQVVLPKLLQAAMAGVALHLHQELKNALKYSLVAAIEQNMAAMPETPNVF